MINTKTDKLDECIKKLKYLLFRNGRKAVGNNQLLLELNYLLYKKQKKE